MATLLGLASLSLADTPKSYPAWTGQSRGMELVSVGRKKVTVILADGRTTILTVPILVERPIGSKVPTFKTQK